MQRILSIVEVSESTVKRMAQELGMPSLEYVENPGSDHVAIVAAVMAQVFDWFDGHSR